VTEPAVSAVVVSHNTRDDLLRCLASLRDHAQLPIEVIVVDNASSDGSVEAVRRDFPAVRVIASPENLGFSRANNLGIREARAAYVLVINSDAEVRPGAVAALAAGLDSRNDVAVVGPRTLSSDETIQISFGPALSPLAEWRQRRLVSGVRRRDASALREAGALAGREHEPDWVSASCFLARRKALDAIGGFDEAFFLYEEDVDLCVRLRAAGWRIVFTPSAEVVHHLGRSMEHAPSRARIEYHRSHLRYYRKHNGLLANVILRLLLMAQGAGAWLSALGPGADRRQRRAEAAKLLWLAACDNRLA
jgi:GT2 family glycosyltransferase